MKKLLIFTGIILSVTLLGFSSLVPLAGAQYHNYYNPGQISYPTYYPVNAGLTPWYASDVTYYSNQYTTYYPNYYGYEQVYDSYQYPSYYGYSANNYYGASAYGFYGQTSSWESGSDDAPDVKTLSARDVDEYSAELRGEVDMNDSRNGRVFFVYGEDRNDIEDVEDEDRYNDVDTNGEDIRKVLMDNDLDDEDDYGRYVYGLDDDTRIYFRLCVEYEDEDGDDRLECGDVEYFRTDN